MESKLQKAIANNNGLYQAIFQQYQINSENNGFIWYCLEETPPLYSNLVTLEKDWRPENIFKQIDLKFEEESWAEWSIKDSFAVLNLEESGFDKLFDARWGYLEAEKFSKLENQTRLRYEVIESERILSRWKLAWDNDENLGNKIFTPKLLTDKNVFFVAGFLGNRVVSGCFVNKTDDVLGVSNFFAPQEDIVYWSDLIAFVYDSVQKKDIVGYEKNELMTKLSLLGFEAVGNLTVWLKERK